MIIADASGTALATASLTGGTTKRVIRNTKSERDQREELIDSLYNLRASRAYGDSLRQAQLRVDRAQLRLHDLDNPGPSPQPFEGHPFEATWCLFRFVSPPLPPSVAYNVTVTTRGTVTYTADQLKVAGGAADLIVG